MVILPSKPATIATSTIPANILPNRRKANERILESSEINSSKPTKKSMAPKNGTLNIRRVLKNLLQIASSLGTETDHLDHHDCYQSQRRVKFISTEMPRKNGARI